MRPYSGPDGAPPLLLPGGMICQALDQMRAKAPDPEQRALVDALAAAMAQRGLLPHAPAQPMHAPANAYAHLAGGAGGGRQGGYGSAPLSPALAQRMGGEVAALLGERFVDIPADRLHWLVSGLLGAPSAPSQNQPMMPAAAPGMQWTRNPGTPGAPTAPTAWPRRAGSAGGPGPSQVRAQPSAGMLRQLEQQQQLQQQEQYSALPPWPQHSAAAGIAGTAMQPSQPPQPPQPPQPQQQQHQQQQAPASAWLQQQMQQQMQQQPDTAENTAGEAMQQPPSDAEVERADSGPVSTTVGAPVAESTPVMAAAFRLPAVVFPRAVAASAVLPLPVGAELAVGSEAVVDSTAGSAAGSE
ncbi:hypothetical protein T492DRAFT_877031, partial [Pavlovales sp. CCMP2436]